MGKYNWEEIEREYVYGIPTENGLKFPTLDELAQRHGCHKATIYRQSALREWTKKREEYLAKLKEQAEKARIEALATDYAQFEKDVFKVVRGFIGKIALILKEDISPDDIKKLSEALRNVHATGRLSMGESTDKTEIGVGEEARRVIEDLEKKLKIAKEVREQISREALKKMEELEG